MQSLALLALLCTALASPIAERSVPGFTFGGDAPFSVDSSTLAAALTCPNGYPTSSAPPVLLVHGTGSTGQETWGSGYVPALAANGYTPCYVTLPGRAMGDMQVSAEYVAYGLHYISSLAGGLRTAVISHSQGGPNVQWALQFWPSTISVTTSFVALSPDFSGINLLSSNFSDFCEDSHCQPSIWQQAQGSHYYSALHSGNFKALVPTTAIWSLFDGVVTPPQQNAQLPGATVLSVQQLCFGRLTNHLTMPIDAAGFVLALDALQHSGKASLTRTLPKVLSTCFRVNAPHTSLNIPVDLTALFNAIVEGIILGSPRVASEPALMPYAS